MGPVGDNGPTAIKIKIDTKSMKFHKQKDPWTLPYQTIYKVWLGVCMEKWYENLSK